MLPKDKTGKSKYFEGIPVPFACFICCSITALWTYQGWIHKAIPYGTLMTGNSLLEVHPMVGIYVICGCLMVSSSIPSSAIRVDESGPLTKLGQVSKTLKVPKP